MSAGADEIDAPKRYWALLAEQLEGWLAPSGTLTLTVRNGLAVTAASGPHGKVTVQRPAPWAAHLNEATAASATPRQLRSRIRVRTSAPWSCGAPAVDLPPARPTPVTKPTTGRRPTATIRDVPGFAHQLRSFADNPHAEAVQVGTGHEVCAVAGYSPVITSAASTGPTEGQVIEAVACAPGTAALIADLIAALTPDAAPDPITITAHTRRAELVIAAPGQTVITIKPAASDPRPWPTKPSLPTRIHDLVVTSLREWSSMPRNKALTGPDYPTVHLRLDNSTPQYLHLYAKCTGTPLNMTLPAITSDRFDLDVSWPALMALWAPAGESVLLRYFDPTPTLTYLVCEYTNGGFVGFTAVAGSRPDNGMIQIPPEAD